MDAFKLAGLEPAGVFAYLEQICAIPHGSGNTKAISDYLVSFAKEQGLRYIQDELNNVILFQEGTCGYEDHPPVTCRGIWIWSARRMRTALWIWLFPGWM